MNRDDAEMASGTEKRSRLVILAFMAWVAVLSFLTTLWWAQPFGRASADERRTAGQDVAALDLGPVGQYDAISERPLFVASREPEPEPVAAPKPQARRGPPDPSRTHELKGTVVDSDGGIAIFMDKRTSDIVRVRAGNRLGAWTLQEVEATQVVLEADGRRRVLRLPRK